LSIELFLRDINFPPNMFQLRTNNFLLTIIQNCINKYLLYVKYTAASCTVILLLLYSNNTFTNFSYSTSSFNINISVNLRIVTCLLTTNSYIINLIIYFVYNGLIRVLFKYF
jgi:hypothetical protein